MICRLARGQMWVRVSYLIVGLWSAGATAANAAVITPGTPFDVMCEDTKIGTIAIDVYQDTSAGGSYSIEIKGGFDKTADACTPMPGTEYRWVQIVKGAPALYDWQNTTDWYIDRTRKADDPGTAEDESKIVADGSPFYVNLRAPGYGHATLGYYDEPVDDRLPIDLYFETALVCTYDMTINVIDSFTWGFEVAADKTFTAKPLEHTGMVSDALIAAFQSDPDPMFATWTIGRGCCCEVPEPSTCILFVGFFFSLVPIREMRRMCYS